MLTKPLHFHLNFILFLLSASIGCFADTTIISYEQDRDFDFLYGSWKKQTNPTKEGLVIEEAATPSGGGGNNIMVPLDLTGAKFLEISFYMLSGNQVKTFNVMLLSKTTPYSDEYHSSRYSIFPGTSYSENLLTIKVLLDPATAVSGKLGPVDLSHVSQIQLQGNYANNDDAFQIQFVDVRAVN